MACHAQELSAENVIYIIEAWIDTDIWVTWGCNVPLRFGQIGARQMDLRPLGIEVCTEKPGEKDISVFIPGETMFRKRYFVLT